VDREEREKKRERKRGGIRGRKMEEMSEDWRSGSFNWTGSAGTISNANARDAPSGRLERSEGTS
jgi:hypothetical protein